MNTETIKTLFRPFLTLLLVITWIVFIAQATPYPPMFQWLSVGAVTEWVGERALKRLREYK